MDSIERGIILDLQRNCRVTLRELADRHGVTPTAIRTRISNLVESGVIVKFLVVPSRAMLDLDLMFALIYTDKSIDDDTFAEMVFENPHVIRVHYDSYGSCVVHAEYSGPEGLHTLSSYFRGLESVRDLEIHTFPIDRGGKKKLSDIDLRVLAPLLEDPRMRVSEIARRSGLTVRRVRRTLDDLIESRAIQFTISVALTRSDAIFMAYRIHWDDKVTSPKRIGSHLSEKFPNEFIRVSHSALEPIAWIDFLIEHNRESELIVQELRKIPSLDLRNTIMVYPPKKTREYRYLALKKMIEESGVLQSS